MKTRSLVFLSVGILGAAACSKDKDAAPSPSGTTKTAEAPKQDKAATAAAAPTEPAKPAEPAKPEINIAAPTGVFACKGAAGATAPASKEAGGLPFAIEACPTIPALYGKLTWGMPAAEYAKATKGVKLSGTDPYVRVGKTNYHTRVDDRGRIYAVTFDIGEPGLAAMTQTWGAPQETTWLSDKTKVWWNPATKTKAVVEENSLADGPEDKYKVYLYQYQPLEELLGEGGILSKGVLGAAAADLAKALPDVFASETDAEAKAKTEALGLDEKATGILAWAGADKGKTSLEYPQFEASNNGSVSLEWKDDKVASYSAAISHGKNDAIKAEIVAIAAKALGKPSGGEQSSSGEWTYTWAGKGGEKITLRESSDWWSFDVSK